MEKTTNYKLYKPSYDDDVDIQILNNNMDILDDNLKRNNDKFKQYLPLSGGTMQGDINVPQEVGLRYDPNTVFKFIMENGLKTLRLEGERVSFQTPKNTIFKIDDNGIFYNNNSIIRDTGTSLSMNGFTKLSTGLILQWGRFSNIDHGSIVTFPTPFTNKYDITITITDVADGTDRNAITYFSCYNINTTGFNVAGQNRNGTTDALWGRWMAIGY